MEGDGSKLQYTYDAAGIKLSQQVYDSTGNPTKTTTYVGGLVYENDKLQFMQTGEGRVLLSDDGDSSYAAEYQYHLKDHLGNVRMTFSSLTTDSTVAANFDAPDDDADFKDNNDIYAGQQSAIVTLEAMNHTPGGSKSLRLNRGRATQLTHASQVGLSKVLAVSEGDIISMEVYGKYLNLQGGGGLDPTQVLAILSGVTGSFSVDGGVTTLRNESGAIIGYLGGSDEADAVPTAGLTYMFLDENQTELTLGDMGFVQLSAAAAITSGADMAKAPERLALQVSVPAGARYIVVDLSHDAVEDIDIYFDDFQLKQQHRGAEIIQEDSYYPY
jgi:hypothetical protein